MAPRKVCKSEPSENEDKMPREAAPASSEWTFPSPSANASNRSDAVPFTNNPSFYPAFFPGGHVSPSNGPAPPPGSNVFYPPPPFMAPHELSGHHPNSFLSHSSPFPTSASPFPAQSSEPSQLPPLPPVPESGDESDLPPVEEIIKKVAKPASKVAGSLRSTRSKGKAKAVDGGPNKTQDNKRKIKPDPAEDVEAKRPRAAPSRGRSNGSANYTREDLDILTDVTREILPIGARGWEEVGRRYNELAKKINRPARPRKSLELKLKALIKTPKPMGSAIVPEHVQKALEIDDLINAKVGAVDLDDDEIAEIYSEPEDDDNHGDDDAPPPAPPPSSQKKPSVRYEARCCKPPSTSQIRNNNQTFLTNIGLALDPSSRQARQDNFQFQLLQNQQMASLTQQLRDSQRRVDSLSAQLIEVERRYQEAERRADRAELRSLISGSSQPHAPVHTQSHAPPQSQSHTTPQSQSTPVPPPISNPVTSSDHAPRRAIYRQDIIYPDGQATVWIGDDSNDDQDYIGLNDSPGTRRITYPDPRSYQPSSSQASAHPASSHQASSITAPTDPKSKDTDDVDEVASQVSQSL